MTLIKTTSLKQQLFVFINWSLSCIFLCLTALAVSKGSFQSFCSFLLITVLCLPSLSTFWKSRVPSLNNNAGKIGFFFVLFIVGIMGLPQSKEKAKVNQKQEKASLSENRQELSDEEDNNIPQLVPVDVYGNFEKQGYKTHKEIHTDGSIWTSTREGNGINYVVTTYCESGVDAVTEVRFNATRTLPQYNNITDMMQFLKYGCSTVLYEEDERDKVNQFIDDNYFNDKASVVISKVKFTIYAPTQFVRMVDVKRY